MPPNCRCGKPAVINCVLIKVPGQKEQTDLCKSCFEVDLQRNFILSLIFGLAGWTLCFFFSVLDFVISKMLGPTSIIVIVIFPVGFYELLVYYELIPLSYEPYIDCLKKGFLLFCLKYKYGSRYVLLQFFFRRWFHIPVQLSFKRRGPININTASTSFFRVTSFSSYCAIKVTFQLSNW